MNLKVDTSVIEANLQSILHRSIQINLYDLHKYQTFLAESACLKAEVASMKSPTDLQVMHDSIMNTWPLHNGNFSLMLKAILDWLNGLDLANYQHIYIMYEPMCLLHVEQLTASVSKGLIIHVSNQRQQPQQHWVWLPFFSVLSYILYKELR